MNSAEWNDTAKRLLKSELIRRGVSNDSLVNLLEAMGVEETKAGIDSKISRGTFSASFLLQCLNAIGCKIFCCEVESGEVSHVEESQTIYSTTKLKLKKPVQ